MPRQHKPWASPNEPRGGIGASPGSGYTVRFAGKPGIEDYSGQFRPGFAHGWVWLRAANHCARFSMKSRRCPRGSNAAFTWIRLVVETRFYAQILRSFCASRKRSGNSWPIASATRSDQPTTEWEGVQIECC